MPKKSQFHHNQNEKHKKHYLDYYNRQFNTTVKKENNDEENEDNGLLDPFFRPGFELPNLFNNQNNSIRGVFYGLNADYVDNSYRFIVNIESPLKSFITCQLLYFNVPYSFYQIDDTRNVLSYYKNNHDPDELHSIIIPAGNYQADEIVNKINSLQSDFIVTLDINTAKLSLVPTDNDIKLEESSTSLKFLGFENNTFDTFETVIIATEKINMTPIRFLNIFCQSSEIETFYNTKNFNQEQLLGTIHLNTSFFDTLEFIDNNPYQQSLNEQNINHIDIIFRDQLGNIIDIGNDFYFILEFQYVYF